jgi:hypothetical protein
MAGSDPGHFCLLVCAGSVSDEAIQSLEKVWIASLARQYFV